MLRPQIDTSLTYESRHTRHMLYAGAVAYDALHPEDLDPLTRYALMNGCILGQPHNPVLSPPDRWADGTVYGLYIPQALDTDLAPEIPIDETLTRTSAQGRGYRWQGDIFYDRHRGFHAMIDVLSEIWGSVFRFGAPDTPAPHTYGLYTPVRPLRK